jgi:hypothetical protein
MRSILFWLWLVLLWAIGGIPTISGFAQADTDRTPDALASMNIAREYVPSVSETYPSVVLPPNLNVPPVYAEIVETMLSRSPTFRRQCDRLQRASHMSVVLDANPVYRGRHARAWTTIRREGNRVVALVRIVADAREAELISHELEHIIEFLDDIDLRGKARFKSSGVFQCGCGDMAYETKRAVHVGQKVAREVRNIQ